ncbi:YbaB/EbfC family nucleoid-associated protein [Actinoallomurus sp. CA-142502]|uniref:YbaB/EbfC family nucleoid-associated protein n=1 Tax=Actinoallomurus sp. CA-142502 TaxID=3239885 RepID=UPI003D8DD11B
MGKASERQDSPVTGTAADGMVRVSFGADGLIKSVTIAPQAKRLAMGDLADAVLEALSAAQEELLRRVADGRREADQEAAQRLSRELEEINAEYLRQTAVYQQMGAEILKRMDG